MLVYSQPLNDGLDDVLQQLTSLQLLGTLLLALMLKAYAAAGHTGEIGDEDEDTIMNALLMVMLFLCVFGKNPDTLCS